MILGILRQQGFIAGESLQRLRSQHNQVQEAVKFGTRTLTGRRRSRWRPGGRDSRSQSGPFVARSGTRWFEHFSAGQQGRAGRFGRILVAVALSLMLFRSAKNNTICRVVRRRNSFRILRHELLPFSAIYFSFLFLRVNR